MNVFGLDGKEYKWPPAGHGEVEQEKKYKSNLHKKAFEFLKKQFPNDVVLQEIPLPGTGKWPLRLDLYLPLRNLAVEIHGSQHFIFKSHIHGSLINFQKAKVRDKRKIDWCEINCIRYLMLAYNEDESEWKEKLTISLNT